MNIRQAAERVVLVRPGPGLVSAAIVAGLDVWVVSDPGPRPTDAPLPAELPPQRLLRVDFDDPAALRALLTDAVVEHGIGQVLYLASDLERGLGSGAAAAAEEVLRELSDSHGRPARGLPDAVAIRRILNESRTSAVRAEEARSITEACSLAEDFPCPWSSSRPTSPAVGGPFRYTTGPHWTGGPNRPSPRGTRPPISSKSS